ncbi:hypothetical protein [Streptomyces sp. NPDC088400]|uniref:hypothetical protein n=1 Tax=Streptomyces sp. NPDC088400 TaxID=3365861 RepID=UPI00380439CF
MTIEFSRRAVLKQLTGVAAGAAPVSGGGALLAPATAVAADTTWRRSTSANGGSIPNSRSSFTGTCDIQGTGLTVVLREGDTATVYGQGTAFSPWRIPGLTRSRPAPPAPAR